MHFSKHIKVDVVLNLKLKFIGKADYVIEVRSHPTSNLLAHGLCEVSGKKIIVYIPSKLLHTETYILFGSGTEMEFTYAELCLALANELKNVLDYIWNNSLTVGEYRSYLEQTSR